MSTAAASLSGARTLAPSAVWDGSEAASRRLSASFFSLETPGAEPDVS